MPGHDSQCSPQHSSEMEIRTLGPCPSGMWIGSMMARKINAEVWRAGPATTASPHPTFSRADYSEYLQRVTKSALVAFPTVARLGESQELRSRIYRVVDSRPGSVLDVLSRCIPSSQSSAWVSRRATAHSGSPLPHAHQPTVNKNVLWWESSVWVTGNGKARVSDSFPTSKNDFQLAQASSAEQMA